MKTTAVLMASIFLFSTACSGNTDANSDVPADTDPDDARDTGATGDAVEDTAREVETVATTCGDNVLDPGEDCDDGNDVPGDGCEPNCKLTPCDDADTDGVCDTADVCPGFDDTLDADDDGVPDGCDRCEDANDGDDDDDDGRPDACDCDTRDICDAKASCKEASEPGEAVSCTCNDGFAGDGVTCRDIDECLIDNGGCDPLTTCTNTSGARTCGPCPQGATGTGETGCDDENECLVDNGGCDPLTVCSDKPGSHACGPCPTGYSGDGDSGCVDIDECLTNNGGCDPLTTCSNTGGARTCGACPTGYSGNGASACVDVDECLTNNGGCDRRTTCSNTVGGRTCGACPAGFSGDGLSGCHDIDECLSNNGGCDPLTTCTNSVGGRTCGPCPAGSTGDGVLGCDDIDECLTRNGGCDPLTVCTNTAGSRTCGACPPGYSGTGNSACIDINECLSNRGGCDPLTACNNAPGSFSCSACPAGYSGTGLTGCADIDECASNNGCDALTTCRNTAGSYTCSACPTGYSGTGLTGCKDIDECGTNNGGCDPLTECNNTPGSRTCGDCPTGYSGTGLTGCADINECQTANGGCDALVGCSNFAGGRSCGPCPTGYSGTGDTACVDINECQTGNGGCDARTQCTNTPGSRTCGACPSGFTGTGLSGCVDIDECALDTDGCDVLTTCNNSPGGFSCSACPSGYSGTGLSGCVDIDECTLDTDGCDALTTCSNTPAGSFTCSACPSGYSGTGLSSCVDINECDDDNGSCDPFVRCTNTPGGRTCGDCPDGFSGTGELGCTEDGPLDNGAIETGGATEAQLDAVFDNWQPSLPPDQNNLVPQPGIAVTTQAQANDVLVTPGALTFSKAAHPEVLEWEPGRIITSLPSEPGSSGMNAFGFARKVASITENGDVITITTVLPAIEEIVTGDFQIEFDASTARVIEWDEFDHAWGAEHLYTNVGLIGSHFPERLVDDESEPDIGSDGEPLPGDPGFWSKLGDAIKDGYKSVIPDNLSGSLRLDKEISLGAKTGVLSYNFKKTWEGQGNKPTIAASFKGSGTFEGSLAFNPRTSLGMSVPNPIGVNPSPVKMWMDIDAYFRTLLEVDLVLEASIGTAGGKAGSELEKAIKESEEFASATLNYFKVKSLGDPAAKPAGGWKKTLWISKPSSQTFWAGPIPIVLVETFQLDVECGFEVKASLRANIRNESSRTFKFRAEYELGGEAKIDPPRIEHEVKRTIKLEGGGEASLTCGLIPRVNGFLYDMIGLNLGVRASGVVKASYASTCHPNPLVSQPKGLVTFGLYFNLGLQFGGRLQAPGSSYAGKEGQEGGFDIGPYELFTKQWPIIERTWDVPGLGYCTPTCRNGGYAAEEPETDVDCGDQCPKGCLLGQHCKVNRDCKEGGYCVGGTCIDNHCLDGVLSGTETATDCGGPKCAFNGNKCALDRRCTQNVDCLTGMCSRGSGFAPDSNAGSCVDDPCLDFQVSPGECARDCGGSCTKCKIGASCGDGAQCLSGVSNGYSCSLSSCANLKKDGSESDLDCGGLCLKCAPGKMCNFDADCSAAAQTCDPQRKVCVKAQCANQVKDPSESDVDCGGNCSDKCTAGKACQSFTDCALGLDCKAGDNVCAAASCDDGWKARLEGDVDCGKDCPDKCALADTCNVARDCESGICTGGHCVAIDCFDRTKNGTETDVDCGGDCTRGCGTGKLCGDSGDCESRNCDNGVCLAATCTDSIRNDSETDVDCGGTCPGCDTGDNCGTLTDCASRKCGVDYTCVAPACDDVLTNGSESDVDCGGTCTDCLNGQGCNSGDDCASATCIARFCVDARCTDEVLDGTESDIDCGGECSIKCAVDQMCNIGSDCATSSCDNTSHTCLEATCTDALTNGGETDLDCGGNCQVDFGLKCDDGLICANASDCVSGVCFNLVCAVPSCSDGVKNGGEDGIDCGGTCIVASCGPLALGPQFSTSGSDPQFFAALGGTLYFTAYEPASAALGGSLELWKSDGTTAGTTLVKDIRPGTAGSIPKTTTASVPNSVTAMGGAVYFAADDGVNGLELWKSDGTPGGTAMVKDIRPGSSGSGLVNLLAVGSTLYFAADDGAHGFELWKSDGMEAGTVMVKDIRTGSATSVYLNLPPVAVAGNVYFWADDGVNGTELWKSNGSDAGTVMVKNIAAGSASSIGGGYGALGSLLFFAANDGSGAGGSGTELWITDGSEVGTYLLKDFKVGTGDGVPAEFTATNNAIYFTATEDGASSGLYTSDGLQTTLIKAGTAFPKPLGAVGNTLYFIAYDAAGGELWKTDGTTTVRVKDIQPGSGGSSPQVLRGFDGVAYFTADDGVHGRELWKSDGTEAGTEMVVDARPGVPSGVATSGLELVTAGGAIYFRADDGLTGAEPWKTDGTEAGSSRVRDIMGAGASSVLRDVGTFFVFAGNDAATGDELWKSNGTTAGTNILQDINPGSAGSRLTWTTQTNYQVTPLGGVLYFTADDGTHGAELWKSDGTTTQMVKDIVVGSTASTPRGLTPAAGGAFYFQAKNQEVWKSDGSDNGTVLIKDIGALGFGAGGLYDIGGGVALFTGPNSGGQSTGHLWKTDGTANGTALLKDFAPPRTISSNVVPFVTVGGTLYMRATSYSEDQELFKSNGTLAGTVLVKDITPGNSGTNIEDVVALGTTVYFTAAANGSTTGLELWKTDGTAPNTTLVKDIWPGPSQNNGRPSKKTVVGSTLFFIANDGTNGVELWKSDGTDAGTVMVKDIFPGSSPSAPDNLIAVGSELYFTANDGTHGAELWKSDGTDAGTVLVLDLNLGGSAEPSSIFYRAAEQALYFVASDGSQRRLWRFSTAP